MLTASLVLLCGALAQAPSLQFDGETYARVFSQDHRSTLTEEYLRGGETLEDWERLIGVRHFRPAPALRDVLPEYLKVVRPSFVEPAQILERSQEGRAEVLLILKLAPPDRSYVEHNLHRFVELPDGQGVLAYQFAWKDIRPASRASQTFLAEHQPRWIAELGGLSVPLFERAKRRALSE